MHLDTSGFSLSVDDWAMEQQAVNEGGRHDFVAEHSAPLLEANRMQWDADDFNPGSGERRHR